MWLRKRRSSSRGNSSWQPPQQIRSLQGLETDKLDIGLDIWWKSSRFSCTACMSWDNIIGRDLVMSRFAVVSLQELCYMSIYRYVIIASCWLHQLQDKTSCPRILRLLQLLARWRSVHNWPLTGVCSLLAALRRTLGRPHHHRHHHHRHPPPTP